MKTFNEGAAPMLKRKGQALGRMHTKNGVKWFLANGQTADDITQRIVTRADVKPVDAGPFADCAQSYRIDPDA